MNVGAFDLDRVLASEPDFLDPDAEHMHDETVTSVGITRVGDCDLAKLNAWFSKLLQERGVDIYRMKGVLSIKDTAEKFVFQGVHMLFEAAPIKAWGEGEERVNKLVRAHACVCCFAVLSRTRRYSPSFTVSTSQIRSSSARTSTAPSLKHSSAAVWPRRMQVRGFA